MPRRSYSANHLGSVLATTKKRVVLERVSAGTTNPSPHRRVEKQVRVHDAPYRLATRPNDRNRSGGGKRQSAGR
jgi:hypothetical protein